MNISNILFIKESDIKYTNVYRTHLHPFSDKGRPTIFDIKINGITYVFKFMGKVSTINELLESEKTNEKYDEIVTLSKIDISGLVKVLDKIVMIQMNHNQCKTCGNSNYVVGYLMERIDGNNCSFLADKESDLHSVSEYFIHERVYKILQQLFDKYKLCHNDLDPSNIMWDPESDKVCIIDIDLMSDASGGSLYKSEHFETNNDFINENFIKRDSYEK